MNQSILDQFKAAGIPMRYKLGDGIIHVKLMLLAGQNKVVFTGSNFRDGDVRPYDPYVNYVDGAWYFTDDLAVVNSFKTRYDDVWIDTATYGNYGNISGSLTRKYPNQGPASSGKADAMFTIGQDPQNYYRIYVEEGVFICQSRIGGTKRNLFTSIYNPSTHRFWRIRHEKSSGRVVFETASDNPGLAASWVIRYSEPWDAASVPLSAVIFELKAGTWQPEPLAPGTVVFDNFRIARP